MEVIAHRAGNVRADLDTALAIADTVELDVHRFRGRLEVRHEKVFWPFAARWERWHLVPSDVPRPTLGEILDGVPTSTGLWLDVKGFDRQLTRRVLEATSSFERVTISSRCWWVLAPARSDPRVRVIRSAADRAQRWWAASTSPRHRRWGDGVALPDRLADRRTIERLARRGSVVVWGVTTVRRVAELAAAGVDGLILDDPTLVDPNGSTPTDAEPFGTGGGAPPAV